MNFGNKSGFLIPKNVVPIIFEEDSAWHGAEIGVRLNVSLNTYLHITRSASDEEQLLSRYALFVSEVVDSWNLSDDDGPLPLSEDGVSKLPLKLVNDLITRWANAVLGEDASDPLSVTTSSEPSEEINIPATPISPDQ